MERFSFNFKSEWNAQYRTSDYLDNLVRDFQVGAPGSSEALISAFNPLIAKYYRLLTAGVWDIDDSDVTSFLRMLGSSDLERTSSRLLCAMHNYENEDIYHELLLCLLKTAKRYTNIAANFRYVAKTRVLTMIQDPLIYASISTTDTEESYSDSEISDSINEAWVNGLTAGNGWDKLTSLERATIKYLYHDGVAEAIAAKKLHMSVRRLRKCRDSGKKKLADYFHIEEA